MFFLDLLYLSTILEFKLLQFKSAVKHQLLLNLSLLLQPIVD
jgi:hypothetical protein